MEKFLKLYQLIQEVDFKELLCTDKLFNNNKIYNYVLNSY